MNAVAFLLLIVSLLILGLALRIWFLAAAHSLLWTESDEEDGSPNDGSLEALDREIEQRTARLAELVRTGGSGCWTARAAILSHRRRLADLERWRQKQFGLSRRWRLPIEDSTAVQLPEPHERVRRDRPNLLN